MRTGSFHAAWATFLLLAATARAAAAPCPDGAFAVQGLSLIGAGAGDRVVLSAGFVSVASGCPAAQAKVHGYKLRTTVIASWPSCSGLSGRVYLRAKIDAATCNLMIGKLRAPKSRLRREFTAVREGAGCVEVSDDTFTVIQDRIFTERGCTLSTCHGPYPAGSLDLRPGASYVSLVDVPAYNADARAAGKKRVVPGDTAASFLSQKLIGLLLPGEGSRMPLIGPALQQAELDLIDAWINAGAPQTGPVPGAPCLPAPVYQPTQPPAQPPGGYQIVLSGPTLQPGQEQEGCVWIPVPNTSNFNIGRWEFALNPGTHHFAIVEYNRSGVPPIGVWTANDFGCFSGSELGQVIVGAPQAPYFVANYPSGVARTLQAGKYLGLNAHYHNPYDVPIQIKVWTNVYPYAGTPTHLANPFTDFDDMFSISVPPYTQKLQTGRYTNTGTQTRRIYALTGHMHKRGLRFTARASDGTKIYENFDWGHPLTRPFEPPFVLAPGDYIDYECLHDNGVERPLKLDGAGNPTTLEFGVTTDDEMCALNGEYYLD